MAKDVDIRLVGPEFREFRNTWMCVVHGLVGDINGPVHYELCPISGSLLKEIGDE